MPVYTLVARPEFDGNQARVQKVGTVWLHPPDDALPEAIQIPCALTEGPQQILRRTEAQRFRGARPPFHRESLGMQRWRRDLQSRAHAAPTGFPHEPTDDLWIRLRGRQRCGMPKVEQPFTVIPGAIRQRELPTPQQ